MDRKMMIWLATLLTAPGAVRQWAESKPEAVAANPAQSLCSVPDDQSEITSVSRFDRVPMAVNCS